MEVCNNIYLADVSIACSCIIMLDNVYFARTPVPSLVAHRGDLLILHWHYAEQH